MSKKIFTIIIIVIMLACSYSAVVTRAATLGEQQQEIQEKQEEAQQKLEYVQEELSSSIVKIQELDDTSRK